MFRIGTDQEQLPVVAALTIALGVGIAGVAGWWMHRADLHDPTAATQPPTEPPVLSFVLASMWSPAEGWSRARPLVTCLEEAAKGPVAILQRETYEEANALLAAGKGDIGLICTGATADPGIRATMDPVYRLRFREGAVYHSVLVVANADPAHRLDDLWGATIAWVDPDSLTGFRGPRAAMRATGQSPDAFFGAATYTHSHNRSIEAVASGLVRVAAVDEALLLDIGSPGVKIVWISPAYPSPPLVVRKGDVRAAAILASLADRPECFKGLGAIGLAPADWQDYDDVGRVLEEGR